MSKRTLWVAVAGLMLAGVVFSHHVGSRSSAATPAPTRTATCPLTGHEIPCDGCPLARAISKLFGCCGESEKPAQ